MRDNCPDRFPPGPIVRINPYELHINDPDYYDEIYAGGGKKRNEYDLFVRLFGMDDGILSTLDHDLHRVRRSALNPFFSKGNVRKLEPIIQETEKVLSLMENVKNTGKPLNIFYLLAPLQVMLLWSMLSVSRTIISSEKI